MLSWPRLGGSSPQFAKGKMPSTEYAENDLEEESPVSSRRKWLTVLVVHMQPITTCSAENPRADSALETFTAIVQNVVADFRGTTEMLGRDTLAGMFRGDGDSVRDVWQGIHAAFTIMEKLAEQNQRRRSQDQLPIRVGIGVHSGPTPPGAPTGTFSALTGNIDKAEGLSILNRQTPFPAIFISKNTLKRLDSGSEYHIQPLGETPLRNQGEPMPVYAMMYALQPA